MNHQTPPDQNKILLPKRYVASFNVILRFLRRNPYLLKHVIFSLHAIVIGLILDGLGQTVGYVAETGEAVKKVARFEFHRSPHLKFFVRITRQNIIILASSKN